MFLEYIEFWISLPGGLVNREIIFFLQFYTYFGIFESLYQLLVKRVNRASIISAAAQKLSPEIQASKSTEKYYKGV